MLREGLSPAVAFKNADTNHNGIVTVIELGEALNRLMPKEAITLSQTKRMAKAFDTNENGLIEEDEFINLFMRARAIGKEESGAALPSKQEAP